MTPSREDYAVAAFCEAATHGLQHRVMWTAIANSLGKDTRRVNSVLFDANVQAAIHAAEWLDRAVETYNPTP